MKQVEAFARKLRIVAFGVGTAVMLVAVMLNQLAAALHSSPLRIVAHCLAASLWFCLALILVQFYRRTRFWAYLVGQHWIWMACVITTLIGGLPALYQVLKNEPVNPSPLTTILCFVLVLAGWIIGEGRSAQMATEVKNNAVHWQNLVQLDLADIALMRFPRLNRSDF